LRWSLANIQLGEIYRFVDNKKNKHGQSRPGVDTGQVLIWISVKPILPISRKSALCLKASEKVLERLTAIAGQYERLMRKTRYFSKKLKIHE
jgi:hypothetical protein